MSQSDNMDYDYATDYDYDYSEELRDPLDALISLLGTIRGDDPLLLACIGETLNHHRLMIALKTKARNSE